MATSPSATLYINNLNDKINKLELRQQLFSLFTTYGKVIDIIAQKGPKMRGQAFLVFADLAEATAAMRACDGFIFYDKPMVSLICPCHLNAVTDILHVAYQLRKDKVICDIT